MAKGKRRASSAAPTQHVNEAAWPRVQELFRMLSDANAPALGVRPDGCVALWNPRMEEITGFEAGRVVGRPLADFVYGKQRKLEVMETIVACIEAKTPELELRIPLRNTKGRNAQVLTNMTPLLAEDGSCVGVYGVGQDVTEWAIQEKQYATVMMQANAPIIELDKEGNIRVWNTKTASMTGYASVDMVGEQLLPVVDESFRKIVSDKIDQALTGIPGADFELPLVTARGSRVEIVLCLTPRFDSLGSVMGVVAIGQDVTERNTKEMEYRKLIETANAPIFGVDTEGRVVIFNTKAAHLSEYSPDEVMGMDLVDTLISEEFRPAVAAVFESAFKGTETANFEFPLVTKTGRKVEILLNATPRYDHTGKLVGVVGIGQDITDRIIQEKEYSRLIDTANAPIFGVDCNCEVIIWNKKAAAITDYTNEDTIGQELFKFISEDYRDAVAKVLSKALEGTGTANFDFPLITKSGRRLDILLNATPKYDHFGNICGVVGIGQDITDRRAQEQEYTRLIDTANAPIFGVDENGCVNIWNRKAADTTQYSNEEVLGANLVENFIPEDFREAVWAVFSQALQGQETANFEFPLITKDGRRVEILLNATSRYNEKGAVIGVVGIGQDITIRMAQEQETNRLIHAANAPIFGVDRDGLVNIWNLKAAEITQYSAEEVMGKDLVNRFVAEEHRATVELELQRALEGEQTNNFDFPLITKTGRRVEILLNATPRYDELGQIFGVVGIGQDITERIAQEQELIRLIDTANAPIFGVDSEGRVNIWNKKATEIMQYPTDAVMGEHLVEKFITKDYQEAVSYVLSEALNGVETANFEFPLITKTGRRVEILLNATPRYNEHGSVIGMVGIGQDITDRIAQEQEYMRLIDTANAPIFGVDSDGRVNIWNRKAADITQYTNEDVLGKDLVAEFISEEYKSPVRSVLEKAFEGVETANFEFPLITKSGRRVEILLNATPRYNEQGEVMGMVGIGQDITDRIAQEKEYMRLIDTANAPIFGVDANGLVNIWNRKAADIMQYTTEDVLGKDLVAEFISEEYKVPVRSVLEKAFEGVDTANFEFPLITRAGRRVEILLNATPRYNEQGEVMGMVGIGQDITDRIAQEQEYSRLIDTANAPIFGIDANMCVNILNNKAAQITNYAVEEVLGEKYVETFIDPEYQAIVYEIMSNALQGNETASFEVPVITKTGRRVNILLNATARFDQHGHIVGVVGIGQDITDRIAQEQEYARLIDSANAPIFGVDGDGLVNIWNKKAAEITQYTPNDVMGENLVEKFITEDYREAVGLVLSKALEGVETANFEFPLMTKAGRRVEILLNATSRFNEHGEVIGMVGIGQDITDRIAQEQEYSRLIDTANAPIFGVDSNGRVNIWNRKAADIMQYTNEDVLGKDLVAEFISNEYKVPVRSVLEKAFEGDETANFEFPLITKAGRRVEILLNATPRYNEHGEVKGMVGIGQDITERIAQEQEYSRLIDTANAPIFGVDANMCVNIWNRKAAQITNYAIDEVMGENLVETFISPEFRPIVAEVLSQALRGEETANFEFPLITRPGTRIEILLNATPRYDSNGSIVGVVGIGQDITDRIAQEHEYFRLIDTANAPIFGIDTNGCINEWNQKIEEITGYHKSSVLGLSLVHTFIIPESRQQVRQLLNQALIGIDVGEMELPMTTKLGVFLLLLVNASSKKDMHGNIRGVIGVGQDYTARKHMEAAKVNFLASFSHELRTPLNGVLGMLELLKEQTLDKAPERYVHMAYVSGSLLLNLINDILDLSKIEAGHLEISAAPFQMHELLDYSIEIFKFKARERGLKLELKCDDNVPKVAIGDVVRLRQVLLNLLSNAIKFTNEGSITVTCSVVYTPELPKAFKKLLFQVIDTGIGMDAEEKMRLFSLFTKLERTRQNNPTGSGLGLAICKQLAELMDGQIGVDSELDVGSNFYFTVVVRLLDDMDAKGLFYAANELLTDGAAAPVNMDTSNVNSSDSSTSAAVANAANNAKVVIPRQARILVAEDNEFNWEVVKCFLQEADHLLQWEVNGRDAVKAYTENHTKFDLVFMDCEMPVMDGYTATKTIRQFERDNDLPRIPVLGLTAYAMSGDRQKCLGSGMDEFMVKPISKNSLLKAIRQWMRVRYLGPKTSAPSVAGSDDYPRASSEGMSVAASAPTVSISSPASSKDRGGDELDIAPTSYPTTSPTPRPSFDSQVDEADLFNNPSDSGSRLAPASRHMQQLDLARAISNLELDDPMAIRRQVGPTVRTAVPTTSIFSLGSSIGNSTRSSGLLTLQRDTGGAIVGIPDWKQINQTSATLPNMKDKPLEGAEASDHVSSHSNPTLWSHPPFMGSKKESAPPSTSSQQPLSPGSVSDAMSARARATTEGGRNENAPLSLQRFESDKSSDDHPAGDPIAAMLERLNISSPAARNGVRGPPSVDHASATTESDAAMRATMDPASIVIPEGDPVDYSRGVQQCGGSEELFLSLLEKFTVSCEAIMSRVLAAYEQGDIGVTRRESHSLKGSSAYVAAMRVSKAAFRVQVACEQLQQYQAEVGTDQPAALADAAVMISLKQSLDDSIKLLKKEHRHLRGYLRRNFEFRDLTRSGSASSAAALRAQSSSQDRANGPCGVM
ncbi:hypothetical protein DVH05_022756 [Phytophthora capsici]|nr:hypothetical protein DVH05_022756 [Phytophthora capsici]